MKKIYVAIMLFSCLGGSLWAAESHPIGHCGTWENPSPQDASAHLERLIREREESTRRAQEQERLSREREEEDRRFPRLKEEENLEEERRREALKQRTEERATLIIQEYLSGATREHEVREANEQSERMEREKRLIQYTDRFLDDLEREEERRRQMRNKDPKYSESFQSEFARLEIRSRRQRQERLMKIARNSLRREKEDRPSCRAPIKK